jgi:hypothetical protein
LQILIGKVAVNWEDAHHLLKGLDWGGAVKDIQACVYYLQSRFINYLFIIEKYLKKNHNCQVYYKEDAKRLVLVGFVWVEHYLLPHQF